MKTAIKTVYGIKVTARKYCWLATKVTVNRKMCKMAQRLSRLAYYRCCNKQVPRSGSHFTEWSRSHRTPRQYAPQTQFKFTQHSTARSTVQIGSLATVSKIVHTWFAATTEFSCFFRMADTCSYSIEERLVASVCVHYRQHTGQTMSQVMAAFRERFNKAPPRRATLLDWEKQAFAVGSVKDRPRSGRKTTRLGTCSGYRFHWTFPNEVDTETFVRVCCATVNNARPHKERLECETLSPNFCELTVGWRHGSALWIMPCSFGHILRCRIPLKGSIQWRMCHLSQCARQKCGVLVKGESQFHAGAGT